MEYIKTPTERKAYHINRRLKALETRQAKVYIKGKGILNGTSKEN